VRRNQTKAMVDPNDPVTIRRYGTTRPCHPGEGRTVTPGDVTLGEVTLGDLAAMVEGEEELVVHDAQTGEDITRSVLKSIIIEQARHG
jgi:polyhydroxyalkanoate synthesis regulator protein